MRVGTGGVGVLSIEVARLVTGSLAISVDLDLAACNVAASYARTAAAAVEQSCGCPEGLRGSVSVMCADMSALQLPLRAGSVDAVGELQIVSLLVFCAHS